MTYTMSLNDALSQLHKLRSLTMAGKEIIIVENNQPIAKLVPLAAPAAAPGADVSRNESTKKRIFGLHRGQLWVSDDFDDPLPDEFWLGEE